MHTCPIVTFKDSIGQHNVTAKSVSVGVWTSMAWNLPILVKEGDRLVVSFYCYHKWHKSNNSHELHTHKYTHIHADTFTNSFTCMTKIREMFRFYLDEVTKNVVSQPSDDEDDDDLDYDDAEASANGPLSY